jgi:tRNA dimethylallyltransferase
VAGSQASSPLVALFGPTSSGKTALSVDLAHRIRRELGAEPVIISADSRQVYKYMDIGTSKTTAAEMRGIRHEMLDVTEPIRRLSLEEYAELARGHIRDCLDAGGVPIIVGGTGVYVKALLEGWDVGRTAGLRDSVRRDFPRAMAPDAYAMLRRLDRSAAAKVHPNNYEGIINALVTVMSGDESRRTPGGGGPRSLVLGLDRGAKEIDARVGATYDEQIRRGLFAEVCDLAARYDLDDQIRRRGRDSENQVLHTHGYREFFDVAVDHGRLAGDLSGAELSEVRSLVLEHIRMYTRRQRTWFKKLPRASMVNSPEQAYSVVARALGRKSA